jgi:hypothetical protein
MQCNIHSLTFPNNGRLAEGLERAMAIYGERAERLFQSHTTCFKRRLRLRILVPAVCVNLISTSAEEGRGEHARRRSQEVTREIRRRGRGGAQLACRRLWIQGRTVRKALKT